MAAIKRSSPLRGSVSASSPQSQTQSYQPAAGNSGFLPRRPNIDTCFACGKTGHWRAYCPAMTKQSGSPTSKWLDEQDLSGVVLSCFDRNDFILEALSYSQPDSSFDPISCNVLPLVLSSFQDQQRVWAWYGLLTKCAVKTAGYWPSSFFCVFMDRDEVEVNKLAKKERGQYSAILTEQTWSIKDSVIWLLVKFCLRDTAGSPERARWLQLDRSGSQSQRAIWFILPARGASHKIICWYWSSRSAFSLWKTSKMHWFLAFARSFSVHPECHCPGLQDSVFFIFQHLSPKLTMPLHVTI